MTLDEAQLGVETKQQVDQPGRFGGVGDQPFSRLRFNEQVQRPDSTIVRSPSSSMLAQLIPVRGGLAAIQPCSCSMKAVR